MKLKRRDVLTFLGSCLLWVAVDAIFGRKVGWLIWAGFMVGFAWGFFSGFLSGEERA